MKRAMILLLLLVATPGCVALGTGLTTAQHALSGFSIHARASFDGELAVNPTYIAVDAKVDAVLSYRAPRTAGGVPVVVWQRSIKQGSGQRAYRVVFSGAEGSEFVQIFKVSWAEARLQMPFLRPPEDGDPAPEAVSPRLAVEP